MPKSCGIRQDRTGTGQDRTEQDRGRAGQGRTGQDGAGLSRHDG